MAGSKPIKLQRTCENCSTQGFTRNLYMITYKGNHGEIYVLETHCNGCGYSENENGEIRNFGKVFPQAEIEVYSINPERR